MQALEDLGRDLPGAPRRLHLELQPRAMRGRRLAIAQIGIADSRAKPLAGAAPRALAQRHAAIGRGQRDLVLAELDLVAASRLARDGRDHLLGHDHQLLIVAVGLVELEHRELGIVLRRDPFVPEVTVDLVDAFDAADRQPLQIELRRDAQEQLHVERVVMRHERPRERAAGNRLHHRRLDLEIAARVQERRGCRRARGSGPRTRGASPGLTIRSR